MNSTEYYCRNTRWACGVFGRRRVYWARVCACVLLRVSATLSCPMTLHKFPLDTQTCPMMFESC